jgi:chlorite dismutase
MSEHMRIGKQYTDVQQLLLYATGLQDHEFVVAYETPDLARFSQLVAELRGTEARRFTKNDTPVRVGVLLSDVEQRTFWS